MDQAMWAARIALLTLGGWAASRGWGDEVLWQAIAGAGAALAGALWSYAARRKLQAVAAGAQAEAKLAELLPLELQLRAAAQDPALLDALAEGVLRRLVGGAK